MISAKTAALFAAACQVGPEIAGKNSQAAYKYGLNLGIAFQLADDALDYAANENDIGKKVGDDFREGKLTAPILIALENASGKEKEFWKRTLSMQNQTKDDLPKALDILKSYQAIEKTLDLARDYGAKAKQSLNDAKDHEIKNILIDLVDYTIDRKS